MTRLPKKRGITRVEEDKSLILRSVNAITLKVLGASFLEQQRIFGLVLEVIGKLWKRNYSYI